MYMSMCSRGWVLRASVGTRVSGLEGKPQSFVPCVRGLSTGECEHNVFNLCRTPA